VDATANTNQFESPAILLDVKTVARLLSCSSRHVWRMADSGDMPRPVKLGSLCRWSRQSIDDWISKGCPRVNH
jgi:excisionase family DNA binding protein